MLVQGGEQPSVVTDDQRAVDDDGRTAADPQAAISTMPTPSTTTVVARFRAEGPMAASTSRSCPVTGVL
ncbi:MAG: hypothetical protein ABSH29_15005 [Acidimicrobiales bacterium]